MVAIDTLGIDHVVQEAHNAVFLLDGTEQMAYENKFRLNNDFELTLHGVSPMGRPAVIGFKTNTDAMTENPHNAWGQEKHYLLSYSKHF